MEYDGIQWEQLGVQDLSQDLRDIKKDIRGEDPGLFILRGWMTLKVLEYPGSTIYLIIYHI